MKNFVIRIMAGIVVLLLISITPSAAPPPENFTECAASGHNCNILITLSNNGVLTKTGNPAMPYYPAFGQFWDIGSLIGFKNSSNSTVYSLHLEATAGSPEARAICTFPMEPKNSPTVKIVHSPRDYNYNIGVYYYYNACPNCLPASWHISCDITFAGGVPKNGVAYFSIHKNALANYTGDFQVTRPAVIPWITFQQAIKPSQIANASLTLFPPNSSTVTLNLTSLDGMAAAVFQANNSTTLTLTTAGPAQIPIRGVTASSNLTNMQLSVSVSGVQRSVNFGVINPQVTIQVESGKSAGTGGFVILSSSQNMTTALTAVGQPAGGSYQWSLGSRLAFNGSSTSANTAVIGTSASMPQADTYVQVTYTVNEVPVTASIPFTVRQPTFLNNFGLTGGPDRTVPVSQQGGTVTGYLTTITYFVEDQFGTQQTPSLLQVPGIDVTEVLLVVQQSDPNVVLDPPEGVPRTAQTNAQGSINDSLSVVGTGGVPNGYNDMIDQQFTVTGYQFSQHQIIRHLQAYATVDLARLAR